MAFGRFASGEGTPEGLCRVFWAGLSLFSAATGWEEIPSSFPEGLLVSSGSP
ncbi:hypothetical protein THTE_2412 [Thermogutta terrifontis]|uniref:Uncharacterized protein n=1 Tax=Thermogutta terrifontis TaxID=1331910 RepID=A0A286RGD0_9BACT|nr:hypothetical protein THTE_2412 [Thermogutta terrifontis]